MSTKLLNSFNLDAQTFIEMFDRCYHFLKNGKVKNRITGLRKQTTKGLLTLGEVYKAFTFLRGWSIVPSFRIHRSFLPLFTDFSNAKYLKQNLGCTLNQIFMFTFIIFILQDCFYLSYSSKN